METQTPDWQAVMERLDRLERANRQWRVVATASLAIMVLLSLLGATAQRVPDEIRARAFVVVASDGRSQARLGASAQGMPELVLYDPKGIERANLSLTRYGDPKLSLRDEDDTAGAWLGATHLQLSTRLDNGGKASASMGFRDSTFPQVSVWREGAHAFMEAASSAKINVSERGGFSALMTSNYLLGGPGISLFRKPGEGAKLYSSDVLENGPILELLHDGKIRAFIALDKEGSPQFQMSDETGKTRAALGHVDLEEIPTGTVSKRPASSLVLFDKDGKVLWKAP